MKWKIIEICPDKDFRIYHFVLWMKKYFDWNHPLPPPGHRIAVLNCQDDFKNAFPSYRKFYEDLLKESRAKTRERNAKKREENLQKIKGMKIIEMKQFLRSYEAFLKMIEREKTKRKGKGIVRNLSKYRTAKLSNTSNT